MNFEVTVPDGASGDWKIETFTVSRDRAALFNLGSRGRKHAERPPRYSQGGGSR